jgi:hypothetical protein
MDGWMDGWPMRLKFRTLEIFLGPENTLKHQQNLFSVSGGHIRMRNLSITNKWIMMIACFTEDNAPGERHS